MRVEKREDGEWLVDLPPNKTGCGCARYAGRHTTLICTHHLDGEHIATTSSGFICARWPIESVDQPADPFASGIVEGLRRVESMMRELAERRGLSDERRLELLAECIAAEITDVTKASEQGRDTPRARGDMVREREEGER